jgi:Tol biopolymer transport system component
VFSVGTPLPEAFGPRYVGFGVMYILDVGTARLRRLTELEGNAPAWSPRGKRIAFAAQARNGSTQIYLVNPDGTHLLQLTHG